MQYCPKCKTLKPESAAACMKCQGEVRPPQRLDPVLLAEDVEYEINNLCAALSEQNIPFQTEGENVSMSSFRSRGFRGNSSIFVHWCDYAAAREIAGSLGFSFPDDTAHATVTPLSETDTPAPMQTVGRKTQTQPKQKEEPEISPSKRRLGRILLFLGVLAAVAAVVLLSDTILGWLRGLFGG